jgi:hypothetical protein
MYTRHVKLSLSGKAQQIIICMYKAYTSFIFFIFLLGSCGESTGPKPNDEFTLKPPSWVQGLWDNGRDKDDILLITNEFTNDDIIIGTPGSKTYLKELKTYQVSEVQNSSSVYEVEIKLEDVSFASYRWTKVDDTTLIFLQKVNGQSIEIEMYKQ